MSIAKMLSFPELFRYMMTETFVDFSFACDTGTRSESRKQTRFGISRTSLPSLILRRGRKGAVWTSSMPTGERHNYLDNVYLVMSINTCTTSFGKILRGFQPNYDCA